jgi:signal transduction histidine kinase
MLGVLRDDNVASGAAAPRVANLEDLLQRVRAVGLDVQLTVEGRAHPLPPALDLSAYRIVEESLTNTLKHARAGTASVLLRYGQATVDLEIVDDGDGGGAPNGHAGGYGIVGMRERVAMFGGSLSAGRRATGGYAVRASLPNDGRAP